MPSPSGRLCRACASSWCVCGGSGARVSSWCALVSLLWCLWRAVPSLGLSGCLCASWCIALRLSGSWWCCGGVQSSRRPAALVLSSVGLARVLIPDSEFGSLLKINGASQIWDWCGSDSHIWDCRRLWCIGGHRFGSVPMVGRIRHRASVEISCIQGLQSDSRWCMIRRYRAIQNHLSPFPVGLGVKP